MQQAVETKPSPLERQLKVAVPVDAARGRNRQPHQEARAHGEDAGLPARQGADQDGRAPLRLPGPPGSAVGLGAATPSRTRCATRTTAWRACRASSPCRARATSPPSSSRRSSRSIPTSRMGDLAASKVVRPVTNGGRQGRRRHRRDAAQAARQVRERHARGRRSATSSTSTSRARSTAQAFEGGAGKNFTVVLGEGRMLPEFEAALDRPHGRAAEELPHHASRTDYVDHLKGKTATFAVTVNQVAEPKLPAVDAEFAKTLGVEDGDVARMRQEIRENIEREVKKRVQAKSEGAGDGRPRGRRHLRGAAFAPGPGSRAHAAGGGRRLEAARHDDRQPRASRRPLHQARRAAA